MPTALRIHVGKLPAGITRTTRVPTRTSRRGLTPITVSSERLNLRNDRIEKWGAVSKDGLYVYDRMEEFPGIWIVTYVPTGQSATYHGLNQARAGTASDRFVDNLRRSALDAMRLAAYPPIIRPPLSDAEIVAERVRKERVAGRQLRILTGRIIMRTTTPPERRCLCGGWLVAVDRQWLHLDVCAVCVKRPARCDPHTAARTHGAGCDTPIPRPRRQGDTVVCGHAQCTPADHCADQRAHLAGISS